MRLTKPAYQLVDCRHCGARKGQHCRGTVRNSHSARITDVYRLKSREAGRRDRRERCPHGNRIMPGNDGPCGCRVFELTSAHLDLANSKRAVRLLRELKPDAPLAPPAPGVEPATAFAERLARALAHGEPMPGMVIEILQAVRERDVAIVSALESR